jgi:myo-inositol-1(or 4)-monophosphatase
MNSKELLAVAWRAVHEGERVLLKHFDSRHNEAYKFKKAHELVTAADLGSNRAIMRVLKKLTPNIPIISEEGGTLSEEDGPSAPLAWVLDPLDGTTNFTVRLPLWGISLALCQNGEPILGVISLPAMDQRYHAIEGGGAWMNGRRIHVSQEKHLSNSVGLLCNGYRRTTLKSYLHLNEVFTRQSRTTRKLGAAVIEGTWVASGRADYSVLWGVHDWDVAAAALLVREAGGVSLTPDDRAWTLGEHYIIMSTPGIAKTVLKHINE